MDYTLNHGRDPETAVVRTSTRAAQRTVQDWQRDGRMDITILDQDGRQIGFRELVERINGPPSLTEPLDGHFPGQALSGSGETPERLHGPP